MEARVRAPNYGIYGVAPTTVQIIDSSKVGLAHFTHRSIHHHREGIQEAVRHFGPVIVNADGVAISIETLALQHLAEDMSIIPSAADWLRHMDLPLTGGPIRLPITTPSAAEL